MSQGTLLQSIKILGGIHDPLLVARDPSTLQSLKDAKVQRAAAMRSFVELDVVAGDASFCLPTDAVSFVAAFFQGDLLDLMAPDEIAALDEHWRKAVGRPVATVVMDEKELRFQVYPKPASSGTLLVVYDRLAEEPPDWLDVPLALDTLSREASHVNEKADVEFAKVCRQLSTMTYMMAVGG